MLEHGLQNTVSGKEVKNGVLYHDLALEQRTANGYSSCQLEKDRTGVLSLAR